MIASVQRFNLTIIIPVYNEVDNLNRIETIFLDYFSKSSMKSKVLFVDDGSTDGSTEKISTICHSSTNFEYISFNKNYGLSTAIKAGIDFCSTQLIGYIDADLQTTPFDFDKLLQHIDQFEMVIGVRKNRKDSWNKRIQSNIANGLRRYLVNDGIKDTGCPLKIMRAKEARKIPFFKGMHRFIPALIQLQGGRVKQVDVQHFKRIAGTSKFNVFNRSINTIHDTFAYRWMKSRFINYEVKQMSDEIQQSKEYTS